MVEISLPAKQLSAYEAFLMILSSPVKPGKRIIKMNRLFRVVTPLNRTEGANHETEITVFDGFSIDVLRCRFAFDRSNWYRVLRRPGAASVSTCARHSGTASAPAVSGFRAADSLGCD
jgi:hypothetical protein